MDIVRPWEFAPERFRRAVDESLRRIREFDPVQPGALRTKLRKVEKALKKVRFALEELPEAERSGILTAEQVRSVEQEYTGRTKKVIVRASGGAKADAARMRIAAECAFDLLLETGRDLSSWYGPTLTKAGEWTSLTELLFELATGKGGKDAGRACKEHVDTLRQHGKWPTKAEMRRLRRHARGRPLSNKELLEVIEKPNN